MGGKTAGIVQQDCRDADVEPEAAEIKVILKARHVHELMMSLPPASPKPTRTPLRGRGVTRV
jgi:hypothetical protein